MSKLLAGIAMICLSVILVISCKHELPLPIDDGSGGAVTPPTTGNPCSPDSVYFQNTILPLLTSNCAMSGCHDVTTHKEGLILNNYTGIMRLVKAGNAGGSKLVSVITTLSNGDVMPPPPMARLNSAQIDAIKKWINQGAKNNICASCDTATFTFSAAVKPILQNKCNGCHTGASAGGGVDLSTYNGVKASAQAGTLLGSIEHKAGYKVMPQGGAKLPECEIIQIRKWVAAGSLNN